ncbi:B3 domain-containing protein Os03g0622100-like [Carex rostrata]
MKRGCKKCSKWEKHFYWSHMDLKKICFCKKMDASSFMNKMDLPNDFHKNFKGRIGETVELKGPSGNVWQVGVIKSPQKFTFQTGWKNFVIANDIEADDLLVFKYIGNFSFQVQIFDPTGCQRTASFFAKREEIQAQESSDSSVKIMEGPANNMYEDKITISGSSSDSEYSTDSTPVRMPRGRASKEAGTSKNPNGGCKFKAPSNEKIILGHQPSLTPALNKRIAQLSEKIQQGNNCFVILVKPSMIMGVCRCVS